MPSFIRFPILRLPLLPFELVIKCSLAASSLKVREYLKVLSFKLEKLHLKRLSNDSYRVQVFLAHGLSHFCLSLFAISPEKWQSETRNGGKTFEIDGRQYMITYHYDRDLLKIYEKTEDSSVSKETLCWISGIISETFTSVREVGFSNVPQEVVPPVVPTKILRIHSTHGNHKTSVLTSEQLSSLLEHNSAEIFELSWNVAEGVKYRNGLRYPTMTLYYAHWLTIDCLLNMDCDSLTAYDVLLTTEDLKTFVNKWLEGGLEKLYRVELSHRLVPSSWCTLLDGFEKHAKLGWKDAVVPNVWEIERSDGQRAEVCASDIFIFKVL